jgi:microcystin-dependent protein
MDSFIGEVRVFSFNWAPVGWAFCDGRTLQVQQNSALYAVIGNTYGGTAPSTFALPNLQGFSAIGAGAGAGLTTRVLGKKYGEETLALSASQMGAHNHTVNMEVAPPASMTQSPTANSSWHSRLIHTTPTQVLTHAYHSMPSTPDTMLGQSIGLAGSSQAHPNMQPCLVMNFCIALEGAYPTRS